MQPQLTEREDLYEVSIIKARGYEAQRRGYLVLLWGLTECSGNASVQQGSKLRRVFDCHN